jgi:lipopolysaccharide export system protein LptA
VTALAFAAGPALDGSGLNNDSNSPVDYAADRIEVQDKAKRVLLTGNVDITQDDLRLRRPAPWCYDTGR